jgi:hypothetical protein
MGVVEAYPGIVGDPDIPPVIYAETHPATSGSSLAATAGLGPAFPSPASPDDLRAQAAGFASDADRKAVRRMRFGK